MKRREGFTLVEMVISLGVLAIIFGGTAAAYSSILDSITNGALRTEATNIVDNQIETMRNLPYASVGTIAGIPSGVIPQSQNIIAPSGVTFKVETYIRNIDDPFDGVLGGTPNDTAPADYKLAEVTISCLVCQHFVPMKMTTTMAPKNLESASKNGSLFINVFDSGGAAVSGANVNLVNNLVAPPINLTDVTNNNGQLQLVGVPTSTQSYHIVVTKSGYSSDQTYPQGGAGNPNPLKPNVTVAASTLTTVSFAIDKTSTLNVSSTDLLCNPSPSQSFSLIGSKLIGTSPNVIKFSTSVMTNASGFFVLPNLEWDTYTFSWTSASSDLAGQSLLSPFTMNPNSVFTMRLVAVPKNPNSLLVSAIDASSSAVINNASVTLTGGAYNNTLVTGHSFLAQTDWSGGKFSSQTGLIDIDSVPGQISLSINASSTYPTSTQWLISQSMDFGSASTTFYGLNWSPANQPPATGSNSVQFQIAANNDNFSWNFTGPNSNPAAYYNANQKTFNGAYDGNRYLRYKVFLTTQNENFTPTVTDVNVEFNGPCVPQGQVLFQGLTAGNYNLNLSAPNHSAATSSYVVGGGYQQTSVKMTPQ